jgi:S-formylglutathione hydrolase FrmB
MLASRYLRLGLLAVMVASLSPGTVRSDPLYRTDGPLATAWQATVVPQPDDPLTLTLTFWSELLGLRAASIVWLPDAYGTAPLPVVYSLHGTVATRTHPAVEALESELMDMGVPLGFPLAPPRGPAVSTNAYTATRGQQRFVVVAPDAGEDVWCPACNWADGPGEGGVAAESHLHRELMPLVEEIFDVRTDRAGRGVIGHSMGGGGAVIQGFRHPDRFAFVGSSSGTLNVFDDPISTMQGRWLYWNRTNGFGPQAVNEIQLRNINALDLAPNVVGSGTEIVAVIGDACLTSTEGSCEGQNPATSLSAFYQEAYQRYGNNDWTAGRLMEAGVAFTYIQREGMHNIASSTYRRYFLERLNRVFDEGVTTPSRISYKAADRSFSVWGYDVTVERPNTEFLHLLGARIDGRDLLLAGTGTVHLTTPAAFTPGAGYRVVLTPAGAAPTERSVTAGGDGRLRMDVTLGATRDMDERKALVDAGQVQFPQTRVEVLAG